LDDWVIDERHGDGIFIDSAHTAGTTRMSDDPKQGVVDSNCRVHGVAGLYVAGASVFPTSGHANPTLMIVSLAIRLADRIKLDLKR
jgi:choline dehydrogenase-like flavoprotein